MKSIYLVQSGKFSSPTLFLGGRALNQMKIIQNMKCDITKTSCLELV